MSADQQAAAPSTAPPRTVPVAAGTNLRRGVSTLGPNDIIGQPLPKGSYPALAQCAGGAVTEGTAQNFWWVKISTAHGDGWVSAVRVLEGGNNQPISGVLEVPTVQAAPQSTTTPPHPVPVAGGTNLRRGASVQGPGNIIGQPVPAGTYPALAQCAGGPVTEGGAQNFWWVLITVPSHGEGWVSAVRVLVGGNNQPISGVLEVPTVQGN